MIYNMAEQIWVKFSGFMKDNTQSNFVTNILGHKFEVRSDL